MEQSAKPTAQDIVHRTDAARRGRWDGIEQAAKILSLVAIPIVVALFGWLIQDAVAKRHVSQEYVKLAVSILNESKEKLILRCETGQWILSVRTPRRGSVQQ
jgi:hypothetical protein